MGVQGMQYNSGCRYSSLASSEGARVRVRGPVHVFYAAVLTVQENNEPPGDPDNPEATLARPFVWVMLAAWKKNLTCRPSTRSTWNGRSVKFESRAGRVIYATQT